MGWRIVRQPNGKLARWSDIVDAFTHYDMSTDEALEVCRRDMGTLESREKVQRGLDDEEPWKVGVKGDGLSRWRDCLEHLPLNRTEEEAVAQLRALGDYPEWEAFVREKAALYRAEREAEERAAKARTTGGASRGA